MNHLSKLRSAHMGAVNSVFVNLEAGVVIGLDEDSIRIWDPVKGVELHAYDAKNTDDVIISGMTSMYRFV
ncbi:MAG: hypothetical protein HKN25_13525 [Pyrinomonadaceae bacterium]|nr:hypothetical protein [Pyrinomonadaceae bacterium]